MAAPGDSSSRRKMRVSEPGNAGANRFGPVREKGWTVYVGLAFSLLIETLREMVFVVGWTEARDRLA